MYLYKDSPHGRRPRTCILSCSRCNCANSDFSTAPEIRPYSSSRQSEHVRPPCMISSNVIGRLFQSNPNIRPKSYFPITFISFYRRKQMTCRSIKHRIFGIICNDLVPTTARYPEKARVVDPRRERGKGRQRPSPAGPRGSNRPMAARKARESGESGSISKDETSELGEKKTRTSLSQKALRGAQLQRNKSPGPKVELLPNNLTLRSFRFSVTIDPWIF